MTPRAPDHRPTPTLPVGGGKARAIPAEESRWLNALNALYVDAVTRKVSAAKCSPNSLGHSSCFCWEPVRWLSPSSVVAMLEPTYAEYPFVLEQVIGQLSDLRWRYTPGRVLQLELPRWDDATH